MGLFLMLMMSFSLHPLVRTKPRQQCHDSEQSNKNESFIISLFQQISANKECEQFVDSVRSDPTNSDWSRINVKKMENIRIKKLARIALPYTKQLKDAGQISRMDEYYANTEREISSYLFDDINKLTELAKNGQWNEQKTGMFCMCKIVHANIIVGRAWQNMKVMIFNDFKLPITSIHIQKFQLKLDLELIPESNIVYHIIENGENQIKSAQKVITEAISDNQIPALDVLKKIFMHYRDNVKYVEGLILEAENKVKMMNHKELVEFYKMYAEKIISFFSKMSDRCYSLIFHLTEDNSRE